MNKLTLVLALFALGFTSKAQSFYAEGNIQKIEIVFAESNWDALLDAQKAGAEEYIMAQSVTINGTFYDSVGVKYKGNSTYRANQTKNPFHIELDTYKDQDYDGYKDIKLSNVANDPSFLREVLSYKILRNYMDAPLSNYANVYVNGTLIGLYSNSEAISKTFVNKRFGSKTNTFVKCNPIEGAGPGSTDLPNLVYLGTDSAAYDEAYEMKSDNGWKELIELTNVLKNDLSNIEDILDVDRALWMLAFNNVLVNLDSYSGGFAQNYYLYRDDNGRFNPIVWDLNESFGKFAMTGSGNLRDTRDKQEMTHLLNASNTSYPLISQLLSVPSYKKMYLAHCKTFLQDNFTNNGSYYTQGQALQATIDTAVQADGNKFYTYNNFKDNLTSDITSGGGPRGESIPGITNLMNGRYTYLMALSDFTTTEPIITDVSVSNATPDYGDNLTFTAKVVNETEVFFRYRFKTSDRFDKVQMYDDGLHGDGVANDDVYGVKVTINSSVMEYYIYAENSTIGKFSPTNAEHNFYSVESVVPTVGDVVINEFMASNDATKADQDGDFDDWIEIYNKGTVAVDISGYQLSDDKSELGLFKFPNGTSIAPNSYLVVWADKDTDQEGYHADFKISASGETVYLSNSTSSILDSIEFGDQNADESFGRYPNGTGNFKVMNPTFGAENTEGLTNLDGLKDTGLGMLIYPNPAEDSFTIEMEVPNQENFVSVINVHGQVVFTQVMREKLTIQTATWKAGMYFVKVGNTYNKVVVK